MDTNLIVINKEMNDIAEKVIMKIKNRTSMFTTDNSDYRVIRMMLSVLKYEYVCTCDLPKYEAFIHDLLSTMCIRAEGKDFRYKINDINKIMTKLPYMSVFGIQDALICMTSTIALYEIVIDECTNFKAHQNSLKKENQINNDDNNDIFY